MYDYNEYTISLNEANVYSAYWQPADSLLFNFAADTNHAGKYNFYKYETRAKELKNKSDGKTVYAISVYSDVSDQTDVFSIGLGLSVVKNQDEYSAYRFPDTLFVDIYGCSDYGCTKAEKIVVHNVDYSFTNQALRDGLQGKTIESAYELLDEIMNAVSVTNPELYKFAVRTVNA